MNNATGTAVQKSEREEEARLRELREAVQDLPDSGGGRVTQDDVDTLKKAGLGDLAETAKKYVSG